jgi:hypothetical protein
MCICVDSLSLVYSQSIQTQFKLKLTESELQLLLDPFRHEVRVEQQFHTQVQRLIRFIHTSAIKH